MSNEAPMSNKDPGRTRPIDLVLVWGFVGIPLLWGVLQTLKNALKLFQ